MLRRHNDQIVDTADPFINPLDHLDSFPFSLDVRQCTTKAMDLQRLRLLQQMYKAHHLNQHKQIMMAQILVDRQRRRQPRPRRYWVKPWLSRRLDYGHYEHLMRELEPEDVMHSGILSQWTQPCSERCCRGWDPELRNMTHGTGSPSTLDED